MSNLQTKPITPRRQQQNGDSRMNRALEERKANPNLSLLDALVAGGFVFPDLGTNKKRAEKMYDTDGVTLYQRKNQLLRRERSARQRKSSGTAVVRSRKEKDDSLSGKIDKAWNDFINRRDVAAPHPDDVMKSLDYEAEQDVGSNLFAELSLEDGAFEEMIYPQDERRELAMLSDKEKNSINDDLYGTEQKLDICSSVINDALDTFEKVLNEIHVSQKLSLDQAERICPDLVGKKQKKMFLWCEEFNVERAVARFVTYWNTRQQLFGDKAYLPLTYDQLSEKDKMAVQSGVFSILPHKDEHGRTLLWNVPRAENCKLHERESMVRSLWYVVHNALEDETVQKNGFVFLADGKEANFMAQFSRGYSRAIFNALRNVLPMTLKALHIIRPPILYHLLMPIDKFFAGHKLRQRSRVHSGTNEEILRSLSDYGFSQSILPSDIGGAVNMSLRTNHTFQIIDQL